MSYSLKSAGIAVAVAMLSLGLCAQQAAPPNPPSQPASDAFAIRTEGTLPKTYPHAVYELFLDGQGNSVPPLHWKVESGALPPGLALEDNGQLHGDPKRGGEYRFIISVTDSGKPQQAVRKEFALNVEEAMTLVWKTPAHVSGGRIEGMAEVSNTTADDIDLTFVALAVAENGRATAIGYQHFLLKRATVAQPIKFGENLPHGAYMVHVDAVGEVAERNVIYRKRLQTPQALQVAVGP